MEENKKNLSGKTSSTNLIPGVNVSEVLAAITGQKSWDEANILDDVSVAGGVRNPESGWIGKTKTTSTKTKEETGEEEDPGTSEEDLYNQWLNSQIASTTATNAANEVASYDDQISNLDRLLGYANTKRQQGIQGIESEYGSTEAAQKAAFDKQRLQNTQNQEKGYGEVGTFANTSLNNLNRLLQGANAGRSSVGQVLAPYMVNQAAETRRKAVTDTAGENLANIDTTADTTFRDLGNQRKKSLQDYESSILETLNDLESQKKSAITNRGLSKGLGYAQARAEASDLESSMGNRYNQLAELFNKYKPDYTVKEAPALSTYQVDPAQLSTQSQGTNDFYLNMLKRKKELGQ